MTDRHKGYVVVLEKDIREDDAEESILPALRMIKGVLEVRPIGDHPGDNIARLRAEATLRDKLYQFIDELG